MANLIAAALAAAAAPKKMKPTKQRYKVVGYASTLRGKDIEVEVEATSIMAARKAACRKEPLLARRNNVGVYIHTEMWMRVG